MRRWPMIVTALAALLGLCAGCASSDQVSSRAPSSGAAGSGSVTSGPVGSGSVTGVPAPSWGPTGPAATAATGSPPPRAAHAVAAIDGATVNCPDGVPLIAGPDDASRSLLPAAAKISAVVRCETVERTYPGLGEWSVQIAEVADSGLGDFVAALRAPSQKRPSNVICPAIAIAIPWFAVVDAAGHVWQPSLPTDQCGQPSAKAVLALNKLHFRAVDAVRGQQMPPSPAISCGNLARGVPAIPVTPTVPAGAPASSNGTGATSSPPSRIVCPYGQ